MSGTGSPCVLEVLAPSVLRRSSDRAARSRAVGGTGTPGSPSTVGLGAAVRTRSDTGATPDRATHVLPASTATSDEYGDERVAGADLRSSPRRSSRRAGRRRARPARDPRATSAPGSPSGSVMASGRPALGPSALPTSPWLNTSGAPVSSLDHALERADVVGGDEVVAVERLGVLAVVDPRGERLRALRSEMSSKRMTAIPLSPKSSRVAGGRAVVGDARALRSLPLKRSCSTVVAPMRAGDQVRPRPLQDRRRGHRRGRGTRRRAGRTRPGRPTRPPTASSSRARSGCGSPCGGCSS